ncbi:hypothetical protein KRE40_05015 [Elizabethkingia meningoseptica]|uniref:Two component regulator three Y domain-containing protein n=2 Tax=Weeksellaceae TaxID=2762318 RepID=A0A1V3U4Y3_ELIME|nr:hypothetical protein [Elizabethkingia meningoseptica]AQX12837.1 hypothetical protein BBD35_10850 [Elizabethkingia meningoseptica]EJK5329710.1 hypothetical protein [Elizabethkingia meningoseptica]MBG0514359.1 hypothetical protein [Elizabethkingia meningoseptica]MCL1675363.1 hypothetical protein [Elizabethkingia meningoseptica]MCL1687222.1 hypothetical protein [Elizabethkingia meningoseptica]
MKISKSYFSSIIQDVYEKISFWGIDQNSSEIEKDFTILINQYVALLTLIFFSHGVAIYSFIGLTVDSLFLLLISLLFALSYIIKEYRKNKYVIGGTFIALNFIITYYSSFCGVESCVFLFYFPLLLAIPFFLSFSKNKIEIFTISVIVLSSLYISAIYNFNLIPKSQLVIMYHYQNKLLIMNITFSLLIFRVTYYFVAEKKREDYMLADFNMTKDQYIRDLLVKIEDLEGQYKKEKLSEADISEVIRLAQTNDAIFIERFDLYFPNFFDTIKSVSNVPLTLSDLYLCAMLKLNFNNKQIALYSNSTVKSVESKKYRLRKKIKIPADQDFTLWITSV